MKYTHEDMRIGDMAVTENTKWYIVLALTHNCEGRECFKGRNMVTGAVSIIGCDVVTNIIRYNFY